MIKFCCNLNSKRSTSGKECSLSAQWFTLWAERSTWFACPPIFNRGQSSILQKMNMKSLRLNILNQVLVNFLNNNYAAFFYNSINKQFYKNPTNLYILNKISVRFQLAPWVKVGKQKFFELKLTLV